jgi:hypothetical protein
MSRTSLSEVYFMRDKCLKKMTHFQIVLTVKLGIPLHTVRKTAANELPFTFDVQEGLETLIAKVKALIQRIPAFI